MNRRKLPCLVAAIILVAASRSSAADPPADLVVHNARIVTVDARSSTAEALAIRDGVFVYVGNDAGVKKSASSATWRSCPTTC